MSKVAKFQVILTMFLVGVGMFCTGYYFGKSGYIFELRRNPPKVSIYNQYPANTTVDFGKFWEVWEYVTANYLERPTDPQKMLQGAIEGMVASLGDPYSSYLTKELNESLNSSLNGQYQGIGAELGLKDNQLIVVAPLDGSPALAAGVRAGDKILEIDGQSTFGITVTTAVTKIRGTAETVVKLKLQRETAAPFDVDIKRGIISVPSVSWEDKKDGTIYIRVSRFGEETNSEWAAVVADIDAKAPEIDAIILDLRGNPGGYLQSAVYIASEFSKGNVPIVYEETATGEQVALEDERKGSFETVPHIIVLLDEGSASASEILAAALDQYTDCTLIGEKSFGKGTVQEAREFKDGSGLHLTIAKWLTPSKTWLHKVGIEPEIKVVRTEDDINAHIDPQLEAALKLANTY